MIFFIRTILHFMLQAKTPVPTSYNCSVPWTVFLTLDIRLVYTEESVSTFLFVNDSAEIVYPYFFLQIINFI
jgi:hypothetical protein